MSADQGTSKAREALERGEVNLAQALGVTVDEEALVAQQGYELMTAGKLLDAQRIFEGLAALNPQNSYYHTALGNIKKAMELPAEAATHLEKALAANPNDLVALFSLADVHMREKRKDKALPLYLQILFVDSEKKSEQGRESSTILEKFFTKDEIRAYVDQELKKLPAGH